MTLCILAAISHGFGLSLRLVSAAAASRARPALVNVPDDLVETLISALNKPNTDEAESLTEAGNDLLA